MILQALVKHYQNLPAEVRTPPGFAPKPVTHVIVLDESGMPKQVDDLRSQDDSGRPKPILINLPDFGEKRTANDRPYFLWDNAEYVLGITGNVKNRKRAQRRSQLFRSWHLRQSSLHGVEAFAPLRRFLEEWSTDRAESLGKLDQLADGVFVFQVRGQNRFVHDDPVLRSRWIDILAETKESTPGQCLVTGRTCATAKLHPAIKGVTDPGGQAEKGIVAFNKEKTAFASFGKEQAFNAPVGLEAALPC